MIRTTADARRLLELAREIDETAAASERRRALDAELRVLLGDGREAFDFCLGAMTRGSPDCPWPTEAVLRILVKCPPDGRTDGRFALAWCGCLLYGAARVNMCAEHLRRLAAELRGARREAN